MVTARQDITACCDRLCDNATLILTDVSHVLHPALQSEKHLSDLVVAKAVAAKIDRPAGLVVFGKHEQPEDVLNSWSSNISNLLELVEKSCQQIQKEAMVHKVQLGSAA